jgi:aerobic carbon-monoxide dehydrogenase large subunit
LTSKGERKFLLETDHWRVEDTMRDGDTRLEDDRLLRGQGRFVANIARHHAPNAAIVWFVRSEVAHARLVRVDAAGARNYPGVLAVATAEDLALQTRPPDMAALNQAMGRFLLARDVVRFVGEPIVAIVAHTMAQAIDAAESVTIDYEPLEVVADIAAALREDMLVHRAAGTNVALRFERTEGGDIAESSEALVSVDVEMVSPRVAIAPIEGRSVLAEWDGERLVVHTSGQGPHPHRLAYASALGLDPSAVQVRCPDTGGAFGAKAVPYPEELVVALLARALAHPLLFVETRRESMAALGHARAQQQRLTLTGTADGELLRTEVHLVADCGAYPRLGAFMPNMGRLMHTGPYRVRSSAFEAVSVVTNTNPTVAYRGAGQPEAAALMERAVDCFALAVGRDPIALRRANLVAGEEFPYTNPAGLVYDSGDYQGAFDVMCQQAGLDELRAEQQRRRAAGSTTAMGIGVACFVESCSTSNQSEHARVRVAPDGSVLVQSGTTPSGQGHETTWARIVADELGVPLALVRVETGDSNWFISGTVTGGSRSVQVGGEAVRVAAVAVHDAARAAAADLFEAHVDDVVYDRVTARMHVQGAPARSLGLAEVATATEDGCLERSLRFDPTSGTVSFGAYLAVVEVDLETGQVTVVRFVAVDDAGTVLQPALFRGQVHGGVVQGIGQALFEEVVYDEAGNLRTANFADYAIPAASEVPYIATHIVETPTPYNALGAKGVGESGPIGAVPAVHNAVIDALGTYGVTHIELPLCPERVWQALRSAQLRR